MARPKNKEDLEKQSADNYQKMIDFIESLDPADQEQAFPQGTMNRNIRDVLAHLYYWHLMMLHWYEIGMKGLKPEMPAKGHTWKTTPALNQEIWSKAQKLSLVETKKMLEDSHQKVRSLINRHSDGELFEKKRYPWTGSTSLGAYLISSTTSHYDWAHKLIRNAKK